jgi:O-antigen/teichoic acid export membrane protein
MMRNMKNLLDGMPHGMTIVRGAFGSAMVKVAGVGITFLLQVMLARLLGVEEFGIYAYVLAWLNVLVLLATLGFENTLVRYVAVYRSARDWSLLRGIVRTSNAFVVLMGLLIAVCVWFGGWFYHTLGAPGTGRAFMFAAGVIPLLALAMTNQAAIRGLKNVVRGQLPVLFVYPLLTTVVVAGWHQAASTGLTAANAMLATMVAALVSLILSYYWARQHLPPQVKTAGCVYAVRDWFAMSIPMLWLAGMGIVLTHTDIIMLGLIEDTQNAGIYGAAVRISMVVAFGLTATNTIVAPVVAELYGKNEIEELRRILRLVARGVFAVTAVVSVLLLLFGKEVLDIFGSEFSAGYAALLVLLAGQLINTVSGPVGYVMTMTGHQNRASVIIGLCAIANIVLNALLIPAYGMLGAASATAITTAMWNFMMLGYTWKKMQINPTIFSR